MARVLLLDTFVWTGNSHLFFSLRSFMNSEEISKELDAKAKDSTSQASSEHESIKVQTFPFFEILLVNHK